MTSKSWQMMSFYRFNGFFGGDKKNLAVQGILWGYWLQTKCVIALPLKDQTAKTTTNILFCVIFFAHSFPDLIHSVQVKTLNLT